MKIMCVMKGDCCKVQVKNCTRNVNLRKLEVHTLNYSTKIKGSLRCHAHMTLRLDTLEKLSFKCPLRLRYYFDQFEVRVIFVIIHSGEMKLELMAYLCTIYMFLGERDVWRLNEKQDI